MTVKFSELAPDEIFNEVMDFIKRNARVQKNDQVGRVEKFSPEHYDSATLDCNMTTPNVQRKPMFQPLHCNHDHYWMALHACYQNTRRQDILGKWINEEFDSYVGKILSEKFGNKRDNEPLRVLGVGSSEGYLETLQLKKLTTKFPRISASVIEPSTQRISEYQETKRQKSNEITGIEYEWHNQTFQQFVTSKAARQKYHFISIINAIYFLGELEDTIKQLYNFLQPGGIIFVVVVKEISGTGLIVKTFPRLAVEEPNLRTTTESHSVKTNHIINSTDVKSVLSKNQMAYSQSSVTDSIDLTTCFTQDEMTPETKLMLDTLTMTVKFSESAPDGIFNDVMDVIKRNTRVEKSDQGDDKYYIDNQFDILIISKQP
ncbi:histamine N-methyltransferase-like [Amphiura filiformis]|uniref:histamine N-methyltransferase-like n=1 Tax=Amphiura filiformis TaxID=82378 RepID=UPI003B2114D6